MQQRSRLKEDAIIGLIFSSFFGIGLFMVSLNPTSVNIQTIILGNILAIAPEDIIQLAAIGIISMAILLLKWKDLMVTFFDEHHARSIGLNTRGLKLLFFTLLAACTVAALQTVGAFLVICVVVTPGATAWLLTDRFPRLLAIAVSIGSLTSFFGARSATISTAPPAALSWSRKRCCSSSPLSSRRSTACWPAAAAPGRPHAEPVPGPVPVSFMVNAIAISIVVAIPCALLSVFLVLKGWALMGDAMSHAVFPGVVLAYIIGIPFAIGAFIAGLLCAVTTGFLDDNSRLKRDTIMGIVFSGMFGAGLVLYVAIQSDVHLDHILFGDMLGSPSAILGKRRRSHW